MKRLGICGVIVWLSMVVLAMPTKNELQAEQRMVMTEMSADIKALKSGTKKPSEVAARNEELADKATSEARKFLFLQGAFKLYARAGDYKAATNVIKRLQTEIVNLNPKVTAELCRAAHVSDDFKGLVYERAESRVNEIKPMKLEKKILDIGCKRKLELIPCPAGTFTMGDTDTPKGDQVRKHKVKITRPFWLSTVAVTIEQWTRVLTKAEYDKLDADVPKTNTSQKQKRQFINALNKVFEDEIPKGYVFRLPTEAEYVYAMTSGGKDKISELSIGILGPNRAEKEANAKVFGRNRDGTNTIRPTTVGLKKPNTWGFYDVINNGDPVVLDAIALGAPPRKLELDEEGFVKSISYDDVEVDPLQYDSEGKILYMSISQSDLGCRKTVVNWDWIGVFRVCLGPDLVAEKKVDKK